MVWNYDFLAYSVHITNMNCTSILEKISVDSITALLIFIDFGENISDIFSSSVKKKLSPMLINLLFSNSLLQ